ncbi:MAG: right-handed parallel beta-helix repeat-containing protein [Geminicoccaceae bacterium]
MTTFTVTTADDVVNAGDGLLSLREALQAANATARADRVTFAPGLAGERLVLSQGELTITSDVSVLGRDVVIDGAGAGRVLAVRGAATEAELSDLTITGGDLVDNDSQRPFDGGGALVEAGAALALRRCTFVDNGAVSGGAISAGLGSRLEIVDSDFISNAAVYDAGAIRALGADVRIADSRISYNSAESAGGILVEAGGSLLIERSTIDHNRSYYAAGVLLDASSGTIADSTVASNRALNSYDTAGGLTARGGSLAIRNSTITANLADSYFAVAGGVVATGTLDIANSIVVGNVITGHLSSHLVTADLSGTITSSDGHNLFGSDVAGSVSGDREGIAASAIFAAIDPATGGGLLSASGIVPLLNSIANPTLSGADPLAASATGQLGGTPRPQPAGSLPDIGSIEINQPLSTSPSADNDVLTGGGGANAINGLAGADYLKGLGGKDTLRGGEGGDLLDGGAGNDRLYGDAGIDLVSYGGSSKVTLDLGTGKAKRGGETDTLHDIEGAIGSTRNDVLKGDGDDNWFQGGLGKDSFTGRGGRDLYDYDGTAESRPGARDVIKDFAHLTDKLDLMGIDADTTVAGNQTFHWVGTDPLSGPGEVGFFTSGGNTIVQASTDADAGAEFALQLTGIKALTATDFYL